MAYRYHRMRRDGRMIDEHRWVWVQTNGPIPVGCEIHHRNGDPLDNRIENLEIMGIADHRRMHGLASYIHQPPRFCEVEGCGKIHWGRGLCKNHWQNRYRKPRRKLATVWA